MGSLAVSFFAFSQQESRNTMTMFTQSITNPAVAGAKDQGDAFLLIREPQMGFKGPDGEKMGLSTVYGSVVLPLKKINSGVGFNFITEKNGLFEASNTFALQYAYQFSVGDGRLGAGISANFKMLTYKFDNIVLPSSVDGGETSQDLLIEKLKSNSKTNVIGAGFGLNYQIYDLSFGVSALNINSPQLKIADNKLKYYVPHIYVYAGYTYTTSNPLFALLPSLQYKGQIGKPLTISASQINFNSLVEYNKFFIFGLSYCTNNDVSLIAGATIKNGSKFDGMRFVGSWDFITSKLAKYTSMRGSVEFTVGYTFNMSIQKTVKTYKSVRFL